MVWFLQVGTNSGLVLIAEPLVDILVHERSFPDSRIIAFSLLDKEGGGDDGPTDPLSPRMMTLRKTRLALEVVQ